MSVKREATTNPLIVAYRLALQRRTQFVCNTVASGASVGEQEKRMWAEVLDAEDALLAVVVTP